MKKEKEKFLKSAIPILKGKETIYNAFESRMFSLITCYDSHKLTPPKYYDRIYDWIFVRMRYQEGQLKNKVPKY